MVHNSGLCKGNEDLKPISITVGCTHCCLAAKVYLRLRPYITRLCQLLQPSSVDVGTPNINFTQVCTGVAMLQSMPLILPWPNYTATKFYQNLMSKMSSTASAETVLQAAQTPPPQKSISYYGTPFLQIHTFSTESSALTQPLMCDKETPSASSFYPCYPSWSYIQGQI